MPFKVSAVSGAPNLESLPVAKIIDYPLEQADYKPFAQARLCVTADALMVQLWAFEVNPSPKSSLKAVFYHPGDITRWFSVQLWSSGELEGLCADKESTRSFTPALQPLWGEDLQGVYWGGSFTWPRGDLTELWGEDFFTPGHLIPGNLYKLSDDGVKPHSGSLFPADFAGGQPFAAASMGEFEIVSY